MAAFENSLAGSVSVRVPSRQRLGGSPSLRRSSFRLLPNPHDFRKSPKEKELLRGTHFAGDLAGSPDESQYFGLIVDSDSTGV